MIRYALIDTSFANGSILTADPDTGVEYTRETALAAAADRNSHYREGFQPWQAVAITPIEA